MRTGRAACATHPSDLYATLYRLAKRYVKSRQVSITRYQTVSMGDFNAFTIATLPTGRGYDAVRSSQDLGAKGAFEVEPAVHCAAARKRITAITKAAGHQHH